MRGRVAAGSWRSGRRLSPSSAVEDCKLEAGGDAGGLVFRERLFGAGFIVEKVDGDFRAGFAEGQAD